MNATKKNTALASAMSGQTPEINSVSTNDLDPQALEKTNALARAFQSAANTEIGHQEDQGSGMNFDSSELKEKTLADKETAKLRAPTQAEQEIILFNAEARKREKEDTARETATREELRLMAVKPELQSATGLAGAINGPFTTPSIESGGGQGHQVHNEGLASRMQRIIKAHQESAKWQKLFQSKNAKRDAAQQRETDNKTIGIVVGE